MMYSTFNDVCWHAAVLFHASKRKMSSFPAPKRKSQKSRMLFWGDLFSFTPGALHDCLFSVCVLDDCVDGTLWRKVGLGETTTMLKGATLNPLNPVSCLAPLKSSAENVNKTSTSHQLRAYRKASTISTRDQGISSLDAEPNHDLHIKKHSLEVVQRPLRNKKIGLF